MCCNNITEKDLQPGTNFPVMLDKIKGMKFFDPHVHMTSRTTDDYQAMADAGRPKIGLVLGGDRDHPSPGHAAEGGSLYCKVV